MWAAVRWMSFNHLQPEKVLITRRVTSDFRRMNLAKIHLIIPLPNYAVFPWVLFSADISKDRSV
jgi:hypothetical protein